MLSKCANPECSEMFRYLRQGKVFRLAPSPAVQAAATALGCQLNERFWLCGRCSQEMTVIWNGTRASIAPLPKSEMDIPPLQIPLKSPQRAGVPARRRAASAGHEDW